MAGTADGTLVIKTAVDTAGVLKGKAQVLSQMKGLTSTISKTTQAMQGMFGGTEQGKFEEKVNKSTAAIDKQAMMVAALKGKYQALSNGSITPPSLKQLETELKNTQKEYDKLESAAVEAQTRIKSLDIGLDTPELAQARIDFELIAAEIDKIAPKLFNLKDQTEALKLNPTATIEAKKLAGDIGAAEVKMVELREKAEKISPPISKARTIMESTTKSIGNLGKNALGSIGNSAKNVFGRLSSGFRKTSTETSSFGKTASMMFTRLKGIILSAFVFNVASKALRGLTEYLGSVMSTNAQFTQSMQVVKGNLLTAFQPILERVMPLLNMLGSALMRITAMFASFTALLGGKSAADYAKSAKALNGKTKAIQGVGKEAKKAEKALFGFDEISKLDTQNDSGGGGGSGAAGGEDLIFASAAEPTEFMKSIAEMIENSDFEGLGTLLAGKVNGIFEKAKAAISWDNLKVGIESTIGNIGSLLNALIRGIDFENIGATLGIGLNTISNTVTLFFDTIDWATLGVKFGEGLNGVVNNTNWKALGGAFASHLQALLLVAYNFVSTFDWIATGKALSDGILGWFDKIDWIMLGETIGKTVNGLVNLIYSFVTNTNWSRIATQLTNGINSLFTTVDWDKLGRTISKTVTTIIDLLSDFFAKVDWMKVGESIADLIMGIDWLELIGSIIKFIGNVILGFGKMLWGFIKQLVKNAVGLGASNSELVGKNDRGGGGSRAFEPTDRARRVQMFDDVQIPKLARGGVIPPNREFMAILGDQRSGTNIEAPMSTIKQGVREVLAEMGGGTGNRTEIYNLNEKELMRVVYKLVQGGQKLRGASLRTGGA